MHKVAPDQPAATPADTARPVVLFPRGKPGLGVLETAGSFRISTDGLGEWFGGHPGTGTTTPSFQHLQPLAMLDEVLARGVSAGLDSGLTPLPGDGWGGFLAYDLAGSIEPLTGLKAGRSGLPLVELHRVALQSDKAGGRDAHLTGHDACSTRYRAPCASKGFLKEPTTHTRPVLRSAKGEAAYIASVERALDYIRAGDIYQANIAHQFTGRFTGSATDIYATLARSATPRHGMCMTSAPLPDGSHYAILSLSPELFLSFDARTRRLTTRPMKGTRPGIADPAELRDAVKDRAELAMIVDLMRNDLGRVCEFGSVAVECARTIEHHGTGIGAVLQATATVSGTVREGLSTGDILAATFPPGSVTGTPKIRAMQIIDELEPFVRGPYCGCLGTFGDDGSFDLAVAIRTAVIHGQTSEKTGDFVDAEFLYCVGAGIVADSDPQAEWQETLDKARVLEAAFVLDV